MKDSATIHQLPSLGATTPTERPNYKRLSDGGHLCRTQAAYRDAVKRFCAAGEEELDYPTNYPKVYPCVVRLRHDRWGSVYCTWMSLDDYKDKLLAQFKEVQGE